MDHATIEEQQIVDRYVAGTLPPDEMERFENHYLSCPECLDRLALAESMQRGFKRMAGQDAAVLATARQLAVVAWLARLGRSRQMAVLAVTLLVLAILPIAAFRGLSDHGQEMAQIRTNLTREQQRSAVATQRAADAEKGLEATRRDLAAQQGANALVREQLAEAQKPQAGLRFNLDVVRDAGPQEGPANLLRLPASARSAVLAVPVYPPVAASYRAILKNAHHQEVGRIEGAEPSTDPAELTLLFPASLLPAGDYVLQVEALTGGKPTDTRTFTLRVRRSS
jgi:anti-sigma factor RsiW